MLGKLITNSLIARCFGSAPATIDFERSIFKKEKVTLAGHDEASIKMESDGSFYLNNLGTCSIAVNGKFVDTGQYLTFSCSCVIEIHTIL